MIKQYDLIGKQFGRLTVTHALPPKISFWRDQKLKRAWWGCQCSCGELKAVAQVNLLRGSVRSCGCLAREQTTRLKETPLTGRQFGRLTVLHKTDERRGIRQLPVWCCHCSCGTYKGIVADDLLRKNGTRSCGCLAFEITQKRGFSYAGKDHPRWDIDITDEERKRRRGFDLRYAKLLRLVLKRDSYTCQKCGFKGNPHGNRKRRGVEVHHIKRWKDFPELRYEPTNCTTLCRACHRPISTQEKKDDAEKRKTLRLSNR